jgi:hypothetical protein
MEAAKERGWLREETDLEALEGELLAVVGETMRPVRASLWLVPGRDRGER